MPVAMPVSDGRTASTISFAIAAKAKGTPTPMKTMPIEIWYGCMWKTASDAMPTAASTSPPMSGRREPYRIPRRPAIGPATKPSRPPGSR